ncbi:LuxR C-terminal-related transcriptional regulator (plasmid) [Klebsiella michiganensis]|uniref:LuxR C-terminal-related transcriptional regulator n=1 Tax=Klebsiella michiganensis TaxID=1134687 RepID=UPI002658E136|nr:LuxR C-terminal-related transcriptional regulator [Klebsiella michiganensis]WKJ95766.1 LuxR C-terminal-related transcriptional regulator [Klebsiella michiganensis]WKK00970.1 LuxR C-terminal-related transcriptional regulator [Klebsiella michiganensis]WKK02888.1 LuxR C-terminal-related transcriptional regulator [Klebsiella michiganensis]WKK06991.1 LuxR C-terminal-related transcriptional regulator [Klebsiella michiganensis]
MMKEIVLLSPDNIFGVCYYHTLRESYSVILDQVQNVVEFEKFEITILLNLTDKDSLKYYITRSRRTIRDNRSEKYKVILCRKQFYNICKSIFNSNKVIHDKMHLGELNKTLMREAPLSTSKTLTLKEIEVLLLLLEKKTIQQIADKRKVSYKTVHSQMRSISFKVKARNIRDLHRIICSL